MTRFFLYPYELTVLCQLSSLLSPGAALVLHPGCTGCALLLGSACRGFAVCPFHFLIPSGPTGFPSYQLSSTPRLHWCCTQAALVLPSLFGGSMCQIKGFPFIPPLSQPPQVHCMGHAFSRNVVAPLFVNLSPLCNTLQPA